MPYFENYDYEALKEKFVRSRFAEDQHFGNEGIEEWLAVTRSAELSFGLSTAPEQLWERLEAAMGNKDLGNLVEELVTPVPFEELPEVMQREGNRDGIKLLRFLNPDLHFYPQGDTLLACHREKARKRYWEFVGAHEMYGGITDSMILFLIESEWERHQPHWQAARQFICDLYAADIKAIREEAEREFDEAIAVSEDGTKIVCGVHEIAIVNSSFRPVARFRGESDLRFFKKNKIRRGDLLHHLLHSPGVWDFIGESQVLMRTGEESVFYTPREYCPNLP
jgi:hypothetical protein